jgi:hypothetical protein
LENRMKDELKVRHSLDKTFFSTKNVIRRNPDRYMKNPTKVFCSTISDNKFALYERPGYHNNLIAKSKSPERNPEHPEPPKQLKRGVKTSGPSLVLQSLLVPEVPKLDTKPVVQPRGNFDPAAVAPSGIYAPRSTYTKQAHLKDSQHHEYMYLHRQPNFNR